MPTSFPYVLSASRRSDIPAFYMPWFFNSIQKKQFELINPFNRKRRLIDASPEQVNAIVFWSKNYGAFLKGAYGEKLKERGYHLMFNFTINASHSILEPFIPPLEERLEQLDTLISRFSAATIRWRFDPICFYRDHRGILRDNLKGFDRIAQAVSRMGISTCTTSFIDIYSKVAHRAKRLKTVVFEDPGLEKKRKTLIDMGDILKSCGISLLTCCEKKVMDSLPDSLNVKAGACISHRDIAGVYGNVLSMKPDRGQRRALGCLCNESYDVGNYALHPCYHRCLYCYANPKELKGL